MKSNLTGDLKPLIYDLDLNELADLFMTWREPDYRAEQVWKGVYQNLAPSFGDILTLPLSLRDRLAETFSYTGLISVKSLISHDASTQKILFQISGGYRIETVLMTYNQRHTLCISTQSGCAMGCVFCATGQMGLNRSLTSGEIIEQVIYLTRQLKLKGQKPTNIVFMGMGEPFHNYEATMEAIQRLNHPLGLNLGERRFTISTVGIIPKITRFTNEHRQINLAISLHAADNDLRSKLLPINKKYPLEELFDVCYEYVATTKRRITFEWALIEGLNDQPVQARALAMRLKGLLCHVNIIPLNPTYRYDGEPSSYPRAKEFKNILVSKGIPCTIRLKRGVDIQAGCGQLATRNKPELTILKEG